METHGRYIKADASARGQMLQKKMGNGSMITLQRPHRGPYREAVAGSDLFGGVSNKSKADADIGTCAGQLWVAESHPK